MTTTSDNTDNTVTTPPDVKVRDVRAIVAVCGNIAAGKTTFIDRFVKDLRTKYDGVYDVQFVPEPINRELLDKFYHAAAPESDDDLDGALPQGEVGMELQTDIAQQYMDKLREILIEDNDDHTQRQLPLLLVMDRTYWDGFLIFSMHMFVCKRTITIAQYTELSRLTAYVDECTIGGLVMRAKRHELIAEISPDDDENDEYEDEDEENGDDTHSQESCDSPLDTHYESNKTTTTLIHYDAPPYYIMLHFKASPELCHARCMKRNTQFEMPGNDDKGGVSMQYLSELHMLYACMFGDYMLNNHPEIELMEFDAAHELGSDKYEKEYERVRVGIMNDTFLPRIL